MHKTFLGLFIIVISACFAEETTPTSVDSDAETEVIIGNPATLGQFPWQAALFLQTDPDSVFWFCSGAIISKDWILTSAQCTYGAMSALVYTGLLDISKDVKPTDVATEFLEHEEYYPDSFKHDISLIKLSKSLQFDDNTKAISLSAEDVPLGTLVRVGSWGKISSNDSNVNPLLNYIDLEIVSTEECEALYNSDSVVSDNILCAEDSNEPLVATCAGDSGGPIIIDFDGEPQHVGIASFVSAEGCETSSLSGHTKTSAYVDWIKEKTGL